jgi:hypothetical protein
MSNDGNSLTKLALATSMAVVFAAVPAAGAAAEKKASKPATEKKGRAGPRKIERLVCKRGTEWNHARIAVELLNGKVQEFAYYSIWKPRTCSVSFQRTDAYSKWVDQGKVTTVTLAEETGAFLIQEDGSKYHFIFRNVDRMRYCGAEGKINGSLTVVRGNPQCVLNGVMDDDPSKPVEPSRAIDAAEAGAVPGKEPAAEKK